MNREKAIRPLDYNVYFAVVLVLALLGLGDSIYLSFSHWRVYTDIGYRSFCAISRTINCDTVSQSPYSVFLGLPVPVWGVAGYTFFLLGLAFARGTTGARERMWALLFWAALAFAAYSIVLALISTFIIHSYCLMCILTYAVNFLLVWYASLTRRRFSRASLFHDTGRDVAFLWQKKARSLPVLVCFLLVVALVRVVFPDYWRLRLPSLSADIPTGVTAEGYPWIGAAKPELEITEFADYQCFQCRKMHFFLRRLMAAHPGKIRLIHRHFPLDDQYNPIIKEPFHVGSGDMAVLAEFALLRGKFWEMNDALYQLAENKSNIRIKELARRVGLDYRELGHALADSSLRYRVKHDIAVGIRLGITGTPGFVINGKLYQGQIPPEILRKMAVE